MGKDEKTYEGAITIFYKRENNQVLYLVVENSETGNHTFVSGAKEDMDESLQDTAKRENKEELGIESSEYVLVPTSIQHEFVFGSKKKSRSGSKGSYLVFVSDLSSANEVSPTDELKSAKWMTKDEAASSLTFPDLREVFLNTVKEMEKIREKEKMVEGKPLRR